MKPWETTHLFGKFFTPHSLSSTKAISSPLTLSLKGLRVVNSQKFLWSSAKGRGGSFSVILATPIESQAQSQKQI